MEWPKHKNEFFYSAFGILLNRSPRDRAEVVAREHHQWVEEATFRGVVVELNVDAVVVVEVEDTMELVLEGLMRKKIEARFQDQELLNGLRLV